MIFDDSYRYMIVSVVCTLSDNGVFFFKLFVLLVYYLFFSLVDDAQTNAKRLDVYCLCRRRHRHVVRVEKMREPSASNRHTYAQKKEERESEKKSKVIL